MRALLRSSAPAGRFDVAVVGAGPAGATAARLLAGSGRSVVLIDPGRRMVDRLEILSPSAADVVDGLQLDRLLSEPAVARLCAGIRRRWTSRHLEQEDFARQHGRCGFVVDRAVFDRRLLALAVAAGAIGMRGRLVDVGSGRQGFELLVDTGAAAEALSASLLIDASGRPAAAARRLGGRRVLSELLTARRDMLDRPDLPSQDAVWLNVGGHDGSWNYSVLGPDGRREGWSVHRGDQRRQVRGHAVNASAAVLTQPAGNGWIAIGDAALAFDPIASQGLFTALSSAMICAGAIASEGSVTRSVASTYSACVMATFEYSERGRGEIYHAMRNDRA